MKALLWLAYFAIMLGLYVVGGPLVFVTVFPFVLMFFVVVI